MQIFLEATESVVAIDDSPEFIRAEITGKSEVQIVEIKETVKAIMAGVNYTLKRHICGHEENGACIFEVEL